MQLRADTDVAAGCFCLRWLFDLQLHVGTAPKDGNCPTRTQRHQASVPLLAQAAKEAVPDVVSTLAIMKRRQRLLISAEVPLVSILCMVRCHGRMVTNMSVL